MYATAAVAALLLAAGAYRVFSSRRDGAGGAARAAGLSQRQQRALATVYYAQKFSDVPFDPQVWESIVRAAGEALRLHNPPSFAMDAEYLGFIYADERGMVMSSTGVLGPQCVSGAPMCFSANYFDAMVYIPPEVPPEQVFALWHTHGGGPGVSDYDLFSAADIKGTNLFLPKVFPNYVGSFLATPQGNWYFLHTGAVPTPSSPFDPVWARGIPMGRVPVR